MSSMSQIQLALTSEIIYVSDKRNEISIAKHKENAYDQCWDLYCCIYGKSRFNLGNRKQTHLNVIVNESSKGETTAKNISDLMELIWQTPIDDEGITRVIFAHGHGVKILSEVSQKFVNYVRQEKNPSEYDVDSSRKTIGEHLAIFTFGGSDELPKDVARIQCNFNMENGKCEATNAIQPYFIKVHEGVTMAKELLTRIEVTSDPRIKEVAYRANSVLGAMKSVMEISGKLSNRSLQASDPFESYIENNEIINKILELLNKLIK